MTMQTKAAEAPKTIVLGRKKPLKERFLYQVKRNWLLYLMILAPMVIIGIFAYGPMYGVLMAFKNYSIRLGVMGSPWADNYGFEHFLRFFRLYNFKDIIWNTLSINLYYLIVQFPMPIILALLLNYLKSSKLKKTVQMVSYAPNFISVVVMCGMITIFLDPETGVFNTIRSLFGAEKINFLAKPELFRHIHVWTSIWQSVGWSSIIYISALSGVDQSMHEAAVIDGANILQRMRYIDIPTIMPTIVMLFILSLGGLMNLGFDKTFLLQNALNLPTSETIQTYTYKVGLIDYDYSFSTAVGLFNSVINITLLLVSNFIIKRLSQGEMSIM